MKELTQAEMEPVLLAHGMAEMEFDVDKTMLTVVPNPHYEIGALGLAIDGRDAVYEMYRRLLAANRKRDIQAAPRISGAAKNTLMQEAYVSFKNAKGERVTGVYLVLVEFDPERKQIIGERMYGDAVWNQMWAENLGEDFADFPGVSRIADQAPAFAATPATSP